MARLYEKLPRQVYETAKAIRDMRIRGAGRIARAAAAALREAAIAYTGPQSREDFYSYMEAAAQVILRTRPTAVSLPNAVAYVMIRLGEAYEAGAGVEELRKTVVRAAEEFIEYSRQAVERIASYGARLVEHGARILTHCNSSAAISVIVEAHRSGKEVVAYATETRPKYQGYITARKLREAGVPVTLIPDTAVRRIIEDIDLVVVGADAVAANGALVNKIGTSQIALVADEAGKPFYAAAESYKFSPATLLGDEVIIEERPAGEVVEPEKLAEWSRVRVANPSFDVTPAEYITGIITEQGIIPPESAYLILRQVFGRRVHEYHRYTTITATTILEEY